MEVNKGGVAERKPINVPNSIKRSSLNSSVNSSADNVIYPPSHQYHYIQYYQQLPPQHHQQQQYQMEQQHQYANPPAALLSTLTTCQCSCSCGNQAQQMQMQQQENINGHHSHQSSVDSQMVNVIVHRQASGSNSSSCNENTSSNTNTSQSVPSNTRTPAHNHILSKKSQSETSLLNHSYQALKMSESLSENIFDCASGSKKKFHRSSSCDCDLECTCIENESNGKEEKDKESVPNLNKVKDPHHHHTNSSLLPQKQQFLVSEAMLTADEITVSESDNNSTTVKRCERNQNSKLKSPSKNSRIEDASYHNTNNIDIYSDGDTEAITEACLKETNGIPQGTSSDLRPPLPPRPPPRPKVTAGSANGLNTTESNDEFRPTHRILGKFRRMKHNNDD